MAASEPTTAMHGTKARNRIVVKESIFHLPYGYTVDHVVSGYYGISSLKFPNSSPGNAAARPRWTRRSRIALELRCSADGFYLEPESNAEDRPFGTAFVEDLRQNRAYFPPPCMKLLVYPWSEGPGTLLLTN